MRSIDSKYWQIICSVLVKHAGNIEWVKLFGSRARGDMTCQLCKIILLA